LPAAEREACVEDHLPHPGTQREPMALPPWLPGGRRRLDAYRSSFVWSRITITSPLTTMLYRPSLVSYLPEGATERLEFLSIMINCFPSITARVPPTRTNSLAAKDPGTRNGQERNKIPIKNFFILFIDSPWRLLEPSVSVWKISIRGSFPRFISAVGSSSRCFVPSGPRRCRRSPPLPPRSFRWIPPAPATRASPHEGASPGRIRQGVGQRIPVRVFRHDPVDESPSG